MPKKTEKGDPLVSSGIVSYTKKRNNYYSSVPCAKWYNLAPEIVWIGKKPDQHRGEAVLRNT